MAGFYSPNPTANAVSGREAIDGVLGYAVAAFALGNVEELSGAPDGLERAVVSVRPHTIRPVNLHMDERRDMERTYREAVYAIDLPGSTVEFRVGRTVAGLAGQSFALITAHNPGVERPGPETNAEANARLQRRIEAAAFAFVPARGMSPDGSHVEPSFAVFGIALPAALDIAEEFGQAAIVWFDGRKARLAWTGEAEASADT